MCFLHLVTPAFPVVVVVANAPAGDVGREEVREGEGGAQEGERRKGQRGGSVPPPVVVPTCRPLRGRWVWQDSWRGAGPSDRGPRIQGTRE